MSDTYQCALCRETFEKAWSDEEAAEEYEQVFGHLPPAVKDDQEVVCDDCYVLLGGTSAAP